MFQALLAGSKRHSWPSRGVQDSGSYQLCWCSHRTAPGPGTAPGAGFRVRQAGGGQRGADPQSLLAGQL